MTGSGGLSAEEVRLSRQQNGGNGLEKRAGDSLLTRFLSGFADPIIRILLIALAINVFFMLRGAPWFETAGIAAAVFLATFVSALSEYGSDAAFRRMQEEAASVACRVRRDGGAIYEIAADEVVCGDLVLLQAGERVPADGQLREGALEIDAAALTGESRSVSRRAERPEKRELLRGSIVLSGEGVMEVTAVGARTVYGGMAEQMQEETPRSPLHVRLEALAGVISRLGLAAALLVAASDLFLSLIVQNGLSQGAAVIAQHVLHAITLAVTVLVVAVPEGLPMMITVVLSSNMVRMTRGHVLVRRLTGIETAGSMNLLFTDKTGTLTTGRMTAGLVFAGDGTRYDNLDALRACSPALYQTVCGDCWMNSGAKRAAGGVTGGNATDRALLRAAMAVMPVEPAQLTSDRVPFDSAYKYAAVRLTAHGQTLVRGAPEVLLPRCTRYLAPDGRLLPLEQSSLRRLLREQTAEGARVLAMAYTGSNVSREHLPELVFTALVVLRDPMRRETPQTVQRLREAGIHTIMLTGDHPDTARAIARRSGLLCPEHDRVIEREILASWNDDELRRELPRLAAVARALPSDKVRLVQCAQRAGLVVGMTGDGVNDAPALKLADVGFSMGSGTAVAREAGDIVITDDNLASIARAVLYGRTIFHSIRKFLVFQLTINFCAVGVSIAGPLLGIDTPVTVMQMLWVNLIMDTLAGLAFSGEPPLPEYMEEPPKRREEPVLNGDMKSQLVVSGLYTVALCVLFLWLAPVRAWFDYENDPVRFLTAFFALFIFCGIFHAFNARTHRLNLLAHLAKNPLFVLIMSAVTAVQLALIYYGGTLFRTTPLTAPELCAVAALALTVVPVDLARKLLRRKKELPSREGSSNRRPR